MANERYNTLVDQMTEYRLQAKAWHDMATKAADGIVDDYRALLGVDRFVVGPCPARGKFTPKMMYYVNLVGINGEKGHLGPLALGVMTIVRNAEATMFFRSVLTLQPSFGGVLAVIGDRSILIDGSDERRDMISQAILADVSSRMLAPDTEPRDMVNMGFEKAEDGLRQ